MGRVHWVGGEKGGVGKSVVARLLAQYWIDRQVPFVGFDTDRSHGALLRFYPTCSRPLEISRMEELDQVVQALDEAAREVLVDLAAQTEAALDEWLDASGVFELFAELGHEHWFWYVIDDGKDSVRLLDARLDALDPSARLVCVLNRGRGRDFTLFEESKLRNRIEQRGGHVIEIPELHPGSMLAIDAHDKSFWAAIHNLDPREGPCLSRMQRQRAKIFIGRAHQTFEALLDARDENDHPA